MGWHSAAADEAAGAGWDSQAVAALSAWPGLRRGWRRPGMLAAFADGGQEIVRVRSSGVAHLRLTRPVIDRLGGMLAERGPVKVDDGDGDWVAVELCSSADVELVLMLTSVAIQANAACAHG